MPDNPPTSPANPLSAGKAVLIGHLVVTLPMLAVFAASIVARARVGNGWLVLAGLAGAWLWWLIAAPRWRTWALGRGAPPEELQSLAAATGLLGRKRSTLRRNGSPSTRPRKQSRK